MMSQTLKYFYSHTRTGATVFGLFASDGKTISTHTPMRA